MSAPTDISDRIAEVSKLMQEKTGASGGTIARQLKTARHQLPRRIARQARLIADAETLLENPRLRPTVSGGEYESAIAGVVAHLESIDLAERRKTWWLGVLGGLAFNLLAAGILFFAALRVFGVI